MRFLTDECVPPDIGKRLQADGHEVFAMRDEMLGAPDEVVLAISLERNAILITEDKDFGEIVRSRGQSAVGILLLRLSDLDAVHRADLVSEVVRSHQAALPGSFCVVSSHALRIRPLAG